jgi:hypothetical protein
MRQGLALRTSPAASDSPDQRPCAKEPQTQRANIPTVLPTLKKTLDGYNNFGCHMKVGVTIYMDFIYASGSIYVGYARGQRTDR